MLTELWVDGPDSEARRAARGGKPVCPECGGKGWFRLPDGLDRQCESEVCMPYYQPPDAERWPRQIVCYPADEIDDALGKELLGQLAELLAARESERKHAEDNEPCTCTSPTCPWRGPIEDRTKPAPGWPVVNERSAWRVSGDPIDMPSRLRLGAVARSWELHDEKAKRR